MNDSILFTQAPLDAVALEAPLREDRGTQWGATVTFAGIVRRHEGELALAAIEYQAYESMARQALEGLLTQAHLRWPPFRAVIAHRTGAVAVGEPSVWIGVAARHRDEAYAVSRFLIDGLKAQAPIWKHQHVPLHAAPEDRRAGGPGGQG